MRQRIEGRLAKLEQTVMDRQPIKPGIVIFQDLDGRLTVYGVEYPDESAIIEALAETHNTEWIVRVGVQDARRKSP